MSIRDGNDPINPVEVRHRSNAICMLHHLSMRPGGRNLLWDRQQETAANDQEAARGPGLKMRPP
jgi:hypothetical protein